MEGVVIPSLRPWEGSGPCASLVADGRVDEAVEHVHHQVDEDELQREKQHQRLDDGVVAHGHGVHQQAAEAGPVEDRLHHDRAAQQKAELQAHHGDDRDERVAQAVLEHHGALVEALGARGAHEVLLHHLDEGGAREARHHRGHRGAQRDGGQDVVLPAVGAHGGQPAELHREHLHQRHAEREGGKGNAGYRERHAQPVGPAVAVHGREDADAHAQHDRPGHGGQGEQQRGHEALADLGSHGAAGADGRAEIPLHHAREEVHELLGQGLVQAQLLANDLHGGFVGVGARSQPRGVAGQHVDEQEHQYRHDQQRGKQPQQSFEEIVQHDAALRCAARGKRERNGNGKRAPAACGGGTPALTSARSRRC